MWSLGEDEYKTKGQLQRMASRTSVWRGLKQNASKEIKILIRSRVGKLLENVTNVGPVLRHSR